MIDLEYFLRDKPYFRKYLNTREGLILKKMIMEGKLTDEGILRLTEGLTGGKRRTRKKAGKDESRNLDLISDLSSFISNSNIEDKKEAKLISMKAYRKRLEWLYDMIDSRRGTFRTTGNTFQKGRFYTFQYVARNKETLELWDARPIILCLDNKYPIHYYNRKSGNIGILGINWHWVPMKDRIKYMKQLIFKNSNNKSRFVNNQALDISIINPKIGMYSGVSKNNALRQYLRAGRYKDMDGKSSAAGMFNIQQVPYSNLTEILETPSIYESEFIRREK